MKNILKIKTFTAIIPFIKLEILHRRLIYKRIIPNTYKYNDNNNYDSDQEKKLLIFMTIFTTMLTMNNKYET